MGRSDPPDGGPERLIRPLGKRRGLVVESQKLLEMRHITKTFPGVHALKDVSFDLYSGEAHALLGENGAGKSTLIKILGGIYRPDGGEIVIEGREISIRNVLDARASGISVIHQELVLVPEMTVAENIFLGREFMKGRFVDRQAMNRATEEVLVSLELNIDPSAKVGTLTTAQQQMVEIAKAMSFNSRILVMDEPTSSLSSKEVDALFDNIGKLKAKGVGIIYISHRMAELYRVSDRVTILRDGERIGTVITREADNDSLIAMMVGRKLTSYYTRTYHARPEKVLEVKGLGDEGFLRDVNFELHAGEILGFAGLVGAGRSEVMKCVFGISPYNKGEILIDGKPARIASPADAMGQGIALVPESRKKEALFMQQDVKYNISIKVLREFIKGLIVYRKRESAIADRYIGEMSIKSSSPEQVVENLSGGNQQKVVIGRWLATKPRILILDEPTRGVDVGSKAEIYAIMNELTESGVAIVMISSELPEILNMSDRVAVMCNGTITGTLDRNEMSQERIMQLATRNA
jgi:inositol transport system ATP-binding protein